MAPKQTADEEEFTELVDADFHRADLVGKGANGVDRFLVAKATEGAGLLDPEFIQSLIAKEAEPVTGSQDNVTVTGSPAAIGRLMREGALQHAQPANGEAAVRVAKARDAYPDDPAPVAVSKAAFDLVVKEKYTTADRKKMAGSGAAMSDGSYPIDDEEDVHNAVKAVGRGGADHNAIRRHVISRAKSLGKSSMIPDNWASDGSLKEPVSKADGPDTDQGVDGLDPTVPLASPDGDAPGDPMDPGSPAWEAIDAATAQKWLTILSRARVAIDLLAEREMVEAVTADPDDADNAFGLQDACCAIDYAISVLAPFAVAEQCEVDTGTMAAVTKAMAGFDGGPLGLVEEFAAVAKACNTLPAATRPQAQAAVTALVGVLKSLPPAPPTPSTDSGQPVAKQEGTAMAGTDDTTTPTEEVVAKAAAEAAPATPEAQAGDAAPVDAGGTTDAGALEKNVPPQEPPGRVTKASDSDALCAVYDASGKLIGVADPSAITPVQGGAAEEPPPAAHEEPAMHDAPGHEQPADLAAKPAADTGTPADEVNKEAAAAAADSPAEATEPGDVAKAADPATETTPEDTPAGDGDGNVSKGADAPPTTSNDDNQVITVTKGTLRQIIAEQVGAALTTAGQAEAAVAKQADDGEDQAEVMKSLAARVAALEAEPAMPKVITNGATPPAHLMRGQDRAPAGGQPVDVAKARDLKGQLVHGTPAEQTEAFKAMQTMAIDALAGIHGRRA